MAFVQFCAIIAVPLDCCDGSDEKYVTCPRTCRELHERDMAIAREKKRAKENGLREKERMIVAAKAKTSAAQQQSSQLELSFADLAQRLQLVREQLRQAKQSEQRDAKTRRVSGRRLEQLSEQLHGWKERSQRLEALLSEFQTNEGSDARAILLEKYSEHKHSWPSFHTVASSDESISSEEELPTDSIFSRLSLSELAAGKLAHHLCSLSL